ncbi:uncharacterized protein [Ptychodera flava]|uniref:uncharacterized protein n=1 Tax=Ptychodera flava TaxID=63121 RepID=UPI003969C175
MGSSCNTPCGPEHGTQDPPNSGLCRCTDPCWHGESCHDFCSGVGQCVNETCDCTDEGLNLGNWGQFCESRDCPGVDEPCSGHGYCNPSTLTCICNSGWEGEGCHIPNCPGDPDCNGRGTCDGNQAIPICKDCEAGWMGAGCELPCVNGTAQPDYTCVCDECYTGAGCDMMCSNHGQCNDGTCTCDSAWWGEYCDIRGCPGIGESCSGRGHCNVNEQNCYCYPGWKGEDCNIPDCPGTPDCSGRGYCNGTYSPPMCICDEDWMGERCHIPCLYGRQSPPNSGICECDPCYLGISCDEECSSNGACANETCICEEGFTGDLCEFLDCPGEPDCSGFGTCVRREGRSVCICSAGFEGEDCSIMVCPGTPECSGRGTCELVENTPMCTCKHGFDGDACETCLPRFSGSNCEQCVDGYIGWNTTCGVLCLHGYATEPGGDQCECYADDNEGYWTGGSCDECIEGWGLPDCLGCGADYVGLGHCDIHCVSGHGRYRDPQDGEGSKEAVRPILQCVEEEGGNSTGYRAWFGYDNENAHNAYIPIGDDNRFEDTKHGRSIAYENMGQPSKFQPGEYTNVFYIRIPDMETEYIWHLAYTPSNVVYRVSVTANQMYEIPCTGSELEEHEKFVNISDPGYCECYHGYWGPSCENECIGGASNPCFGRGQCNGTTGDCLCDVNFLSYSDCTVCAPGWMGDDCSVGYVNTSNTLDGFHLASTFGLGHFTTCDGASYHFYGRGEYHLFSNSEIEVQIRMVACNEEGLGSCVNAVAVKVGARWVTVHSGYTDDDLGGVVWIDGVEAFVTDTEVHIGSGYYFSRISIGHYSCHSDLFFLDIYNRDRYMDLRLRIDSSKCSASTGLLSSCDDDPLNDFVTKDGELLTPHISGTLHQNNIHEEYGPSWLVTTTSSLFVYNYGQYDEVRDIEGMESGYALFFNDSHMYTEQLYTFSDSDVTFEFHFKISPELVDCGTVMSYTKTETLSVTFCQTFFLIDYGSKSAEVFMTVNSDVWYQMSLVWQVSSQLLKVYVFDPEGALQTKTLDFTDYDNILMPGGVLTLGQWKPPVDAVTDRKYAGFIGWIDEMTIWKQRYELSSLRSRSGIFLDYNSYNLASLWRFNEGEGLIVHDATSIGNLHMVSDPWRNPKWVYSSTRIERPSSYSVTSQYAGIYWSEDFEIEAEQRCRTLIYGSTLGNPCTSIGMVDFYYITCIKDVANNNDLNKAMEVVLAYSDHCMLLQQLTQWPAQAFCQEFIPRHFPNWIGTQCDVPCISGTADGSDTEDCVCYHGFWEDTCDQQCMASAFHPCSDIGICGLDDGMCECAASRDKTSHCSSCSHDWVGEDCISAVVNINPNTQLAVCSVFTYSHFTMFDGSTYDLHAVGEFHLLDSQDLSVYVRQVPCGGENMCVNQVWIETVDANLTIHAPYDDNSYEVISLDGDEVLFDKMIAVGNSAVLTRTKTWHYEFNQGSLNNISMTVSRKFISIQITVPKDLCNDVEGTLCGSCDGDRDNDFKKRDGTDVEHMAVTYDIINSDFADFCRVNDSTETAFRYTYNTHVEDRKLTSGGYSLHFDHTHCETRTLVNTFDLEDDVTIEFLVRGASPTVYGGTLLSYVNVQRFAITNDDTIKIHHGTEFIDTGMVTATNEWVQISFVYFRSTRRCTLYYFNEFGEINGQSYTLTTNLFTPGGTIALGIWQPGVGGNQPDTEFVGDIDELRIWRRSFEYNGIRQNYRMNVQPDVFGLGGLWKFSEGRGSTASDLVHSHHIRIPSNKGALWYLSNAPVSNGPICDYICIASSFSDVESRRQAESQCSKAITESEVYRNCESLGSALAQFHEDSCLIDVAYEDSMSAYVWSVDAYSAFCQATLELPPFDPCKNDTSAPGCGIECVFGTPDYEKNTCVCNKGFWGESCTEVCPGGTQNPCNGHGMCMAENGLCRCDVGWSDGSNCTECAAGWTGDLCTINTGGTTESKLCSVFGQGHYNIFDGARFDFKEIGEYYLAKTTDSTFAIQVRVLPCYTDSACLSTLAIKYNDDTMIARAGYTSSSSLLLWSNGVKIDYQDKTYRTSEFVFNHMSTNDYIIRLNSALEFQINIHVVDKYISLTTEMSEDLCSDFASICGSCDGNITNDITDIGEAITTKVWDVDPEGSLFGPIFGGEEYNEKPYPTGAGYCLLLEGSYIASDVLTGILDGNDDISIEFLVKLVKDGIILSYSSKTAFTLTSEGTVKIYVDNEAFDTGLILETDNWNHISIVWKQNIGQVYIYVISTDGTVNFYTFFTTLAVFGDHSTISFGAWQPSQDESVTKPTDLVFVGEVDELKVWKRALTSLEVEQGWFVNILPGTAGLAALWKFNEGEGDVVYDLIGGANFYFIKQSWHLSYPIWRFSYAPINLLVVQYTYVFASTELELSVYDHCTEVIRTSDIASTCSDLSSSTFDFYFKSCQFDMGWSGSYYGSFAVTVSLSDYCHLALEPTVWPAKTLCNAFPGIPFPVWSGTTCDVQCYFPGSSTPDGESCTCAAGYWGTICDSVCRGGSISPCSGHGICARNSGDCECEDNWKGSAECSQCTEGWKGSDCSLPVTPVTPSDTMRHCFVSSSGFFTLFDGASITFRESGEYLMYKDHGGGAQVHVQQTACNNQEVCTVAVAIKTDDFVFVIDASSQSDYNPSMWLNDVIINPGRDLQLSSDFQLHRRSLEVFEISGPNGFFMKLFLGGVYFDIYFDISRTHCGLSTGICGPCEKRENACSEGDDLCWMQNIGLAEFSVRYTIHQQLIYEFCSSWNINTTQTIFPFVQADITAGYALHFDNSGLISQPIPAHLLDSDYVTLQFYTKISVAAGTLISYTEQSTFSISITNQRFCFHFGSTVIVTDVVVETDVWIQISIVYYATTGRLEFYCLGSSGIIYNRYYIIGIGIFKPEGSVGLGTWQLPPDGIGQGPTGYFVGDIDGLVIWKKRLRSVDIVSSWRKALSRYEVDLISLWNFDCGYGSTSYDLISNIDFIFPISTSAPSWYLSGAELTTVITQRPYTTVVKFSDSSLEKDAQTTCYNLIFTGTLQAQCGTLSVSASYYYLLCLTDVAMSGNLNQSMDAILSFSAQCEKVLNLPSSPAQGLCNEFPDRLFPIFAGDDCLQKCYFGVFTDGACICHSGFWGSECSSICPGGGPQNPCNGHGICDSKTGQCDCDKQWAGDSLCGSCSDGWTGGDCSIIIPELPETHPIVCTARDGFFINFDSKAVEFQVPDVIQLVEAEGIELQIKQTVCRDDDVCIDAVGVVFFDDVVTIHHNGNLETKSYLNYEKTTFYAPRIIGNAGGCSLTVTKFSPRLYMMTIPEIGFFLQVSVMSSHMLVNFEISSDFCCSSDFLGICGPCEHCSGIPPLSFCSVARRRRSVDTETATNSTEHVPIVIEDQDTQEDIFKKCMNAIVSPGIFREDNETGFNPNIETGAGHCVFLNHTHLGADKVEFVIGTYTTIEFLIKTCHPSTCGGTILSYSGSSTFFITNEFGFLTLHFGNFNFTTDIVLEVDVWNQISLVWDRSAEILNLYVFNQNGTVRRQLVHFSGDIFLPGGTVYLGNWQASPDGTGFQPSGSLIGYIDELRIWKRYFDNFEVQQNWNISLQPGVQDLTALWKFNDGEADILYDSVSNIPLYLRSSPVSTKRPEIKYSDAPIPIPRSVLSGGVSTKSVDKNHWANSYCHDLFYTGPMYSDCGSLGDSIISSYYDKCVANVIASNSTEDAMEIVLDLAAYCQMILELPEFPAQPLCNEFDDYDFPGWIGEDCDTPCDFGTNDPADSGLCVCQTGFWGEACNRTCPVSVENPCNSVGRCLTDSGMCVCPENWQGNENCTECSRGWLGQDCTLTSIYASSSIYEPVKIHISIRVSYVLSISQLTTLSGVNFVHYSVGEFYLLRVLDYKLIVQVKFVRCYGVYSCVKYLGIRFGDYTNGFTKITFRSPTAVGGCPRTIVNGKETVIDTRLEFGLSGYIIERLSYDEMLILGPTNFRLILRTSGKYLVIDTEVPDTFCNIAVGALVGNCCGNETETAGITLQQPNNNPLNLCNSNLPQQDPSPMLGMPYDFPQDTHNGSCISDTGSEDISQDDVSSYMDHWRVDICDSVIDYPNTEAALQTTAGSCLRFRHTSISPTPHTYYLTSTIDMTIEMRVRCTNSLRHCGAVFSYTNRQTFALLIENVLIISYDGASYHTTLTVEVEKWNKIVLVYDDQAAKLNVYCFTVIGMIKRQEISIKLSIHDAPGSFAIGQWQAQPDGLSQIPIPDFDGDIDEFRVWNRVFDPVAVQEMWDSKLPPGTPNLHHYWPMDEEEGDVTRDAIGRRDLLLPNDPWNKPEWLPSDLTLPDHLLPDPLDISFDDEDLENEAHAKCSLLILSTPLSEECKNLGKAVFDSYFTACLRIVASTGNITLSYEVAFTFSDVCQSALNLTYWPAYPFCKDVPNMRRGTQCKDDCVFGYKTPSGDCVCYPGFFDDNCTSVCPGNSLHPCSDRGVCEGEYCVCDINWRGRYDCSECGIDWLGNDCTLALYILHYNVYIQRTYFVASISTYTRFINFDGVTFYLGSVGEFYLLRLSTSVNIHIQQIPCYYTSTCLKSIALSISTTTVIIQAPANSLGKPGLWINRRSQLLQDMKTYIGSTSWFIITISDYQWEIHSSETDAMVLVVRFIGMYMQVSVKAPKAVCETSTGLLGNCNNIPNDDIFPMNDTKPLNETSQDHLNEDLAEWWKVPRNNSLFVTDTDDYLGLEIITGGVYSLYFDSTSGMTNPLTYAFADVFLNTDITIEFLVKPTTIGGIMLSYGLEYTFAIVNDITIRIYHGQEVFDTKVTNIIDEWNYLAVIVYSNKKTLEFIHREPGGRISRRSFVIESSELLQADGVLSLGHWQAAPQTGVGIIGSTFVGELDELRIWNRSVTPAFVDQSNKLNVQHDDFSSELTGLYKLNAGEGVLAKDLQNKNDFILPGGSWKKPIWQPSDADVPLIFDKPFVKGFSNDSYEALVLSICVTVNGTAGIAGHCGNVSQAVVDFYYMTCLTMVTTTGNTEVAFDVLMTFSEYCQTLQDLDYSPLQRHCNDLLQYSPPNWFVQFCSDCMFGLPTDDGTCLCPDGFWGSDCSNVCPGGQSTPCHSHGNCDLTGLCACKVNWNGDVECGLCATGWTGGDCSIVVGEIKHTVPSVTRLYGGVTIRGKVMTIGGVSIYISAPGWFNLITYVKQSISVNVRYSTCVLHGDFTFGFDTLVINHGSIELVIRASLFSRTVFEPIFWLNKRLIQIDHETYFNDNFHVKRIGIARFQITIANLHLYITGYYQYLEVNLGVPKEVCDFPDLTGLLASCETLEELEDIYCSSSARDTTEECYKNITQGIINDYTDLFRGPSLDYRKYESYHQILPLTGAGFALYFKDSIVISNSLIRLPNRRFTIEVLIRMELASGTILSFSSDVVFAVVVKDTVIYIQYGTEMFNTDLDIEIGAWNQISLQWIQSTEILEIYHFNAYGHGRVRAVKLDRSAFMVEGTLALGQWFTATDKSDQSSQPESAFVGLIDEVRVWDREPNPSLITGTWMDNILEDAEDLVHLWKMNDGDGDAVKDIKNGDDLHMPKWNKPKWKLPEMNLTVPMSPPLSNPVFFDEDLKQAAESKCSRLLLTGHLYVTCLPLGIGVIETYYLQCVSDVAYHRDIDAAIEAVVALSDFCYYQLGLNPELEKWPGQELCNEFPSRNDFPFWIGTTCEVKCLFGQRDKEDENLCVCEYGYWGVTCEHPCQGGIISPCNNHGACNTSTGLCSCELHWQNEDKGPEYSCSECAPGWAGTDCMISYLDSSESHGISIVFGNIHFTTLDAASYQFDLPGVYQLMATSVTKVQALFLPCNGRTACRKIVEVAVFSDETGVSVVTDPHFSESIAVSRLVSGKWELITEGFTSRETSGTFSVLIWENIVNITTTDGISIVLAVYSDVLSCIIESAESLEVKQETMIGSWDYDWINDLNVGIRQNASIVPVNASYFLTDVLSQDYVDNTLSEYFHVDYSDRRLGSDLAYAGNKITGYMLRFSNNHVTVPSILFMDLREFTISFWVNIHNDNYRATQTVLVVDGTDTSFIVKAVSGMLTIIMNDLSITTELNVEAAKWTHVAITWRAFDGRLVIYSYTAQTKVTLTYTKHYIFTAGTYSIVGDLNLGQLIISGRVDPAEDFQGDLDLIRIWSYCRHIDTIKIDRDHYLERYIPGLLLSMGLEEGYGMNTSVRVFLEEFWFDRDGQPVTNSSSLLGYLEPLDSPPQWIPSDAPISVTYDYRPSFSTGILNKEAKDFCQEMFFTGTFLEHCIDLTTAHQFYYEACLGDIAAADDVAKGNVSVHMFSVLCQRTLELPEEDFCGFHKFCEDVPIPIDDEFPFWIIIIIIIIVLIIIITCCICCIICCLYKKKKKKKKEQETEQAGSQTRLTNPSMMPSHFNDNDSDISSELAIPIQLKTFQYSDGDEGGKVDVKSPIEAWQKKKQSQAFPEKPPEPGEAANEYAADLFQETQFAFQGINDEMNKYIDNEANIAARQTEVSRPSTSDGLTSRSALSASAISAIPTDGSTSRTSNLIDLFAVDEKEEIENARQNGKTSRPRSGRPHSGRVTPAPEENHSLSVSATNSPAPAAWLNDAYPAGNVPPEPEPERTPTPPTVRKRSKAKDALKRRLMKKGLEPLTKPGTHKKRGARKQEDHASLQRKLNGEQSRSETATSDFMSETPSPDLLAATSSLSSFAGTPSADSLLQTSASESFPMSSQNNSEGSSTNGSNSRSLSMHSLKSLDDKAYIVDMDDLLREEKNTAGGTERDQTPIPNVAPESEDEEGQDLLGNISRA